MSPLYAPPNLQAVDRDYGLPGLVVPDARPHIGATGSFNLTANGGYAVRFRPSRPMRVASIGFVIAIAAGANDAFDVGLHDGAGQTKLGSSGVSTAYKDPAGGAVALTTTGFKALYLTTPVDIEPGKTYHACLNMPAAFGGSTPAANCCVPNASGAPAQGFGQAVGLYEFFRHASAGAVPATLTPVTTTLAPFLWVREV